MISSRIRKCYFWDLRTGSCTSSKEASNLYGSIKKERQARMRGIRGEDKLEMEKSFEVQVVWGCLADVTPSQRYDTFADHYSNVNKTLLSFWTEKEMKMF